jgi:hypothetical protein
MSGFTIKTDITRRFWSDIGQVVSHSNGSSFWVTLGPVGAPFKASREELEEIRDLLGVALADTAGP